MRFETPRRGVPRRRTRPTLADVIRPGALIEARHWHDPDCRRPQGEACTCQDGPDVELVELDPRDPTRN